MLLVQSPFDEADGTHESKPVHGRGPSMKVAVLLVAFGSTVPEAQKSLLEVEARLKQRHPHWSVHWAFTAGFVRRKCAAAGQTFHAPEEALDLMREQNYDAIVVQSLHVIAGLEFHRLKDVVESKALEWARDPEGPSQKSPSSAASTSSRCSTPILSLGQPLLSSSEDLERACRAMLNTIPSSRRPEDVVVFMGHGTPHVSGEIYKDVDARLKALDAKVRLATVEESPSFEDLWPELMESVQAVSGAVVYLIPFLLVAGDHALNDMLGDREHSWKRLLNREGIEVVGKAEGLAKVPEVVDIWLDHLDAAISAPLDLHS